MEINNSYIFDLNDIGNRVLVATYGDVEATCNITITGPNLRSTEEDNTHLFLKSSDGRYLNIKEWYYGRAKILWYDRHSWKYR